MAVYLNFPEAPFTPHQRCPDAHFEIVVVNQKEESLSIRLGLGFPSWQALTLLCPEARRVFTSKARDWGYAQFLPLRYTKKQSWLCGQRHADIEGQRDSAERYRFGQIGAQTYWIRWSAEQRKQELHKLTPSVSLSRPPLQKSENSVNCCNGR